MAYFWVQLLVVVSYLLQSSRTCEQSLAPGDHQCLGPSTENKSKATLELQTTTILDTTK